MLIDVVPQKGTNNVIIVDDGFKNVRRSDFKLLFNIRKPVDVSKLSFITDGSVKNSFLFSITNLEANDFIEILINGSKKDDMYLVGVQLDE